MSSVSSGTKDLCKKDVLMGAKAIFKRGLVEIGEGNVSTRIPNEDELFITPTYNRYDSMTERDIVHLGFDGSQISKGKRASTEYRLHVAVYRARSRANCVIHTHSPYATMLSIVRRKIPLLMEEMIVFLGGEVDVSEFGLAHTEEIGKRMLKALGKTNSVLLANHGALVCGRNMEYAVKNAELVEKMARIYWGALQIGRPKAIPKKAYDRFYRDFISNFATY